MVRKSPQSVKHMAFTILYFPWNFISIPEEKKFRCKYLKVLKHRLATFLRIFASDLKVITIYTSQTSRYGKQKYGKSNIIYLYV